MNDRIIEERYRLAREQYAELGVDTEASLAALARVPLSIHCWQGDDVGGFETGADGTLGGGIAATGNYPGKARSMAELRADLEALWKLLPGRHRLALHMIYGDFGGKRVERDAVEPRHFDSWLAWAAACGVKLDMNGTFFSHPKAASGLTLSSKDEGVRAFWVEHARRTRAVSAYLGRKQGDACIDNLWIPDGMKDVSADRAGYRRQLLKSLDQVFAVPYPPAETRDALEGKLFGIGSESFVVGSHEFYLAYAAKHGLMVTLDSGHYHPTESVADKVSALLAFFDEVMVHISRGVRWDSDHVVLLNDESRAILEEVVRCGRMERVHLGLDFFDASINRLGAWTVGARSVLKAILLALLEPRAKLVAAEEAGDYFARMQLLEHAKTLPFGAVWDRHCRQAGAPVEAEVLDRVAAYDAAVTRKRS
ncbi:MAG TPA: L-rhamnose isomerase [Desulfobacterales bacterium]|nr:L-rhamnose isomerase [Desulfobacterales bacterium]